MRGEAHVTHFVPIYCTAMNLGLGFMLPNILNDLYNLLRMTVWRSTYKESLLQMQLRWNHEVDLVNVQSQGWLADRLGGRDRKTVRKYLHELDRMGWIKLDTPGPKKPLVAYLGVRDLAVKNKEDYLYEAWLHQHCMDVEKELGVPLYEKGKDLGLPKDREKMVRVSAEILRTKTPMVRAIPRSCFAHSKGIPRSTKTAPKNMSKTFKKPMRKVVPLAPLLVGAQGESLADSLFESMGIFRQDPPAPTPLPLEKNSVSVHRGTEPGMGNIQPCVAQPMGSSMGSFPQEVVRHEEVSTSVVPMSAHGEIIVPIVEVLASPSVESPVTHGEIVTNPPVEVPVSSGVTHSVEHGEILQPTVEEPPVVYVTPHGEFRIPAAMDREVRTFGKVASDGELDIVAKWSVLLPMPPTATKEEWERWTIPSRRQYTWAAEWGQLFYSAVIRARGGSFKWWMLTSVNLRKWDEENRRPATPKKDEENKEHEELTPKRFERFFPAPVITDYTLKGALSRNSLVMGNPSPTVMGNPSLTRDLPPPPKAASPTVQQGVNSSVRPEVKHGEIPSPTTWGKSCFSSDEKPQISSLYTPARASAPNRDFLEKDFKSVKNRGTVGEAAESPVCAYVANIEPTRNEPSKPFEEKKTDGETTSKIAEARNAPAQTSESRFAGDKQGETVETVKTVEPRKLSFMETEIPQTPLPPDPFLQQPGESLAKALRRSWRAAWDPAFDAKCPNWEYDTERRLAVLVGQHGYLLVRQVLVSAVRRWENYVEARKSPLPMVRWIVQDFDKFHSYLLQCTTVNVEDEELTDEHLEKHLVKAAEELARDEARGRYLSAMRREELVQACRVWCYGERHLHLRPSEPLHGYADAERWLRCAEGNFGRINRWRIAGVPPLTPEEEAVWM